MEPFPKCLETLAAPPEPRHCFLPDDHPFRHISPMSAHIRYIKSTHKHSQRQKRADRLGNLSVGGSRHAQCGVKYSAPQ